MHTTRLGRVLVLAVLLLGVSGTGAAADPAPPPVPLPGGSNYDFYYLQGCYREPYHVVNGFNRAPDIIRYQLGEMRKAGQSRLTIGIFHHRGPDSGTIMDSTGGKLSDQNRRNLTDLLAAVKQAGFAEVAVAFNSLSPNSPSGWSSWQPDLYQENWQLIQDLHPVIAGAGLPYRVDLGNELTASAGQKVVLQYDQQLWKDYTAKFGRNDSVGFSVNSNDPNQVGSVGQIYGTTPPPLFDIHVYDQEYERFLAADTALRQAGYTTQPIIVGESFYNDKAAAEGFAKASKQTGRQIYYLTQWPKTRANVTQCDQVDVAPPADFSAYKAAGF
ncbi:hypothetical protein GCM10010174_36630 [Kutzneria viridogrisea]|uniref:Cellulase (Glycosyl hydrolase family 5) n=2 Tax=Kutzneria TaxID=43356 RepID=A0ABR6BU52_9PSEU|nr:hypothetical protein [Kutzneria albida]AHH94783.1 putative secreted protein [Kutzneria albida DSM 43870]MBA8930452.1 hypothetical protein [Kutzneria viridogrisea]